jgi:hypothetical protein
MWAGIAADFIVAVHAAFILWAVFGGLAMLRHRWLAWLHLPAFVWASLIEFAGLICPLTPLEKYFRRLAGEAGYSGGFIQHYVTSVIYPEGLTRNIQVGLGVALVVFNAAIYIIAFSRRSPRATARDTPPLP